METWNLRVILQGFVFMGPTGTEILAMQIMSVYRLIDDIKFIMNGSDLPDEL